MAHEAENFDAEFQKWEKQYRQEKQMKVAQMDKLQCELEQAHDLILMKDYEINALKSKPLSAAVDHFDTPIAEIV